METVSLVLLPTVLLVTSPLGPPEFFFFKSVPERRAWACSKEGMPPFPIFFKRQYALGVQSMGTDHGLERTDFRGGSSWNRS